MMMTEDKILVCQNCKETMTRNEKYCTNCGASRNSAAFEPLENHRRFVYGPPIKMKYECHSCNHLWISVALGAADCNYCPECGSKEIELLVSRYYNFGEPIGILQPMSKKDMKSPLLTEEEVKKLLDARHHLDDIEGEDYEEKLVKIGFPEAGRVMRDKLTERESERIILEEYILELKGDNPYAFSNEKCPQCGSRMHASIVYYDAESSKLNDFHNKADGSELYSSSDHGVNKMNADRLPALSCLCCGKKFGKLVY